MGKIRIVDDCLAPARFMYLDYSGPDPFGVAKTISDNLTTYFRVSSSGISETVFNWDKSGDPVTFYFTWWVQKGFSKLSGMKVWIKVQGSKSKTKNAGKFTMELSGELHTKFSFSTSLLKPFWWIYSHIFYNRRRRNYVFLCKEYIENFKKEIAEHFNLQMREG